MAPTREEITSAHRSRAQYANKADSAILMLKMGTDELAVKELAQVTNGDIALIANLLTRAEESLARYEESITRCLEMENMDEEVAMQDKHYLASMKMINEIATQSSKLAKLKADFEAARLTNTDSLSVLNTSDNPQTPRINTSLKPTELEIATSLTGFKVWRAKFQDYFVSNKMQTFSHQDQRAYLRGCLAVDTINTMEQFMDVTQVMSVTEVLNKLEEYFTSTVSIIRRR